MNIFTTKQKEQFMLHHPIEHLFSFSVAEHIEVHQFERGEWINNEGSFPEYLYWLITGRAKIYATEANGKIALVNFAEPNVFIGEMELLNDSYYSQGIQTTALTTCYALPLKYFKEALLNDVIFLRHLSRHLSDKAAKMSVRFSQAQSYPLENRLADFILVSAHDGIYKEKHTEVSDYLGVSYRHLLFILAQFVQEEILIKEKRGYLIINEEALRVYAEPIQNGY